jgi:hypothetical protein
MSACVTFPLHHEARKEKKMSHPYFVDYVAFNTNSFFSSLLSISNSLNYTFNSAITVDLIYIQLYHCTCNEYIFETQLIFVR